MKEQGEHNLIWHVRGSILFLKGLNSKYFQLLGSVVSIAITEYGYAPVKLLITKTGSQPPTVCPYMVLAYPFILRKMGLYHGH